ncbi:MAG: hypothetical protein M1820_001970 [Bogoriella megaspora]|nr:MAG: hypothetical protein M1820_001970 [Bogoriella megaspora]
MALMRVPNELLDYIIEYTLPHGFESMALTCRRFHTLCKPFIEHHSETRFRFQDFRYYRDPPPRCSMVASSDLITLTAAEPMLRGTFEPPTSKMIANFSCMHLLMAKNPSPYRALTMVEPLLNCLPTPPTCAKRVLTGKSTIPRSKRASERDAIHSTIMEAERRNEHAARCRCRKGQAVEPPLSTFETEGIDLSWMSPFLALPHMSSFYGPSCLALGDNLMSLASGGSRHMAETLQAADFVNCCIDDVRIADFLAHIPQLKFLTYWHYTKNNFPFQEWDICRFVNAVAHEAGSRLLEFSVIVRELRGSVVPGKASMHGSQKLKELEYLLELVMCNINASGVTNLIASSNHPHFVLI